MDSSIEKIGRSVIQHDKENCRVYLMKLYKEDHDNIIESLEKIAVKNKYTKIIAKIPWSARSIFVEKNYSVEAEIPNLFRGIENGYLVAKYLSKERKNIKETFAIQCILSKAIQKREENTSVICDLEKNFDFRIATKKDYRELAIFYRKIFETYPFPIHEEEYILETMNSNVIYFTIWNMNELVAVASSEMDEAMINVEMTDFGTLPEYRGRGFGTYLLGKMDDEMRKRGMKIAYTIARSMSYGMNITFAKLGYNFAGILPNNTNISGGLESMNVWFKEL